jgi:threonine/homoserine/homoserine lactone efflux protein
VKGSAAQARVNGPAFLAGWVLALAVVSAVVYVIADQSNAATSSSSSDTISWGKIVLGAALLLFAGREWRSRPAPGADPPMPKWMAGIDALTPVKALGPGVLLAGVNPKNLVLTIGAAAVSPSLGSRAPTSWLR